MEQTPSANRDCGCSLIPRAKKPATERAAEPSPIRTTTSTLTRADRRDHFLARWGYKRNEHRVEPGLYALGNPTPESPVFVSANYTLSFDALRSALGGVDGHILVLDTYGINVWCAAGKGTFGTDELVRRIESTGLGEVVSHRKLILPQLGAPGVAAHEVKKRTGFKVEYGPVRAPDLPEYLRTGAATPEMRRVRFPLKDRLVLVPVELVHAPQIPSPQPYLVPVRPKSVRNTHRSMRSRSRTRLCGLPLSLKRIVFFMQPSSPKNRVEKNCSS